jgi:hypothetical protein
MQFIDRQKCHASTIYVQGEARMSPECDALHTASRAMVSRDG